MQKIIVVSMLFINSFILSAVSSADIVTKKIGIVIFDGVITSEVTAPVEVFGHVGERNGIRYEVSLVAEKLDVIKSNEGLKLTPDYTFDNSPSLDVLIVPSSYNVEASEKNSKVVNFVKDKGAKAEYLASNCAGAFIVGEAGLLDGKKMVTYVGGGVDLKKRFPKAIVQDEHKNTVFVDGKYISSNGVLVSYTSALKLLEMMNGKKVSNAVKADLYYDRLVK